MELQTLNVLNNLQKSKFELQRKKYNLEISEIYSNIVDGILLVDFVFTDEAS